MIIKEISMPLRIQKVEALVKRLPKDHPKAPAIEQDLVKLLSGYKGEKALTYYLDFLPEKGYYIFHNLRLASSKYFFQLDYLILTSRFATIVECKNFYGTLEFDESFKQLIRTANGQEEAFPDPISQAKWHRQQLNAWLQHHKLPYIPIDFLIIISNPSTIIKTGSKSEEIKSHIAHSQIFLERLEELGGKFKKDIINEKGLRKLSKLLVKEHTPDDVDILKKYEVDESDILSGVQCPNCESFGMLRKQRKWFCQKCEIFDRNAHWDAVRDYFLLKGFSITNQQFREFVHLSSIDAASKLLLRMNLPHSGTNKGRKYHRPPNF